jgi:CheY-like chemotaxis protein
MLKSRNPVERRVLLQDSLESSRTAEQQKVLLVDDDAISLEILALMLGCDGHEVLRASDGEAALQMLSRDCGRLPDVLLVDMQMPGISGESLAERIRAMQGPHPLLLAMSATAVERRNLRGFDGFLQKPLAIEDLRSALHSPRKANGRRTGNAASVRTAKGGNQRAASTAAGTPPVDVALQAKLAKTMPAAALRELYEACMSDSRDRAAILEKLVLEGKLAEIPREAHRIKGGASMIGATRLAAVASELERGSCKEEDTRRLVSDLQRALDELERILLASSSEKVESRL